MSIYPRRSNSTPRFLSKIKRNTPETQHCKATIVQYKKIKFKNKIKYNKEGKDSPKFQNRVTEIFRNQGRITV